jgi:hypothetical protein
MTVAWLLAVIAALFASTTTIVVLLARKAPVIEEFDDGESYAHRPGMRQDGPKAPAARSSSSLRTHSKESRLTFIPHARQTPDAGTVNLPR